MSELGLSSLEQLQLPWDLRAAPSACREITEPDSSVEHGRRTRRNGCKLGKDRTKQRVPPESGPAVEQVAISIMQRCAISIIGGF